MMVAIEVSVVYHVAVVQVNNITCKTLLVAGAGSCYVSLALLRKVNIQPVRLWKKPNGLTWWCTQLLDRSMFEIEIEDLSWSFLLKSELSKTKLKEKRCYWNYKPVLKQHHHLRNITMNDRIRITGKKKRITHSSYIWCNQN